MKTIENQEFEKVTIKDNLGNIKCLIGFDGYESAAKAAEWLGRGWSVRLIKRHQNRPWEDHGTTNGPIQATQELYGDNYRVFAPNDTLILDDIKGDLTAIIDNNKLTIEELIDTVSEYINEQSELMNDYNAKGPDEAIITKEGHFYEKTSATTMRHLNPDGIVTAVALAALEEDFDVAIDNDYDFFADKITSANAAEIISSNSVVYCYNADTQFIDTEEERDELINDIKKYGVKELHGSDLDDAYLKLGIPECFDVTCYSTTGYNCVNAIFAIIY